MNCGVAFHTIRPICSTSGSKNGCRFAARLPKHRDNSHQGAPLASGRPTLGSAMNGDQGIFAEWQPRYAQHGVATFPVRIIGSDKKPGIKGYLKTGLRGSAQLALKFAEAQSF